MSRTDLRLIVEQLDVSRGGRPIVTGVSFELSSGQGILITGPNGSGKSTLLRAIAGFLPLDRGHAQVEPVGEPVWAHAQFLSVANAMKPALTVGENLKFHQDFYGAASLSVGDALDRVDLAHVLENRFGDLSTGQRRRVGLARLLLNDRPIWLIDEPTSGLDKEAESRFVQILSDHLETGGIIVAATHLPIPIAGLRSLRFEEELV